MPRDISARWAAVMAQAGVCTRSLMGDGCTVARTPSCSCVFTAGADQRRAPFVANTHVRAQIARNSFVFVASRAELVFVLIACLKPGLALALAFR